jgi:hypothetical protein
MEHIDFDKIISIIQNFPYWIAFAGYTLAIATLSLWPFDFDFGVNKNHAKWIKDVGGVEFQRRGQLLSAVPPKGLQERLSKADDLTVEVWIQSYHPIQSGPARIISYSRDTSRRNFTLAQSGDALVMRLRTTKTDLNGMNPHFEAPRVFHETQGQKRIRHIVFTYNGNKACVFVDGREYHCDGTIAGDFLNWAPDHHLVIGNEVTADRPWLGEIHYAAVFSRALAPWEIRNAFSQGRPRHSPGGAEPSDADRLVAYTFETPGVAAVRDRAGGGRPLDLFMPKYLPPFPFDLAGKSVIREFLPSNLIPNLAVFIPIGFFLLRAFRQHAPSGCGVIPAGLAMGLFIAFGIEYLQHYLPNKHSSWPELLMKFTGFTVGMALQMVMAGYARSQKASR